MKLRSQIVFAQLPGVIIITLITIFFIFVLNTIERKSESILLDNFKSILAMQRLYESLESLNIINDNLPKSPNDFAEAKKLELKIMQQIIIQEEKTDINIEEEALTKNLRQTWELYKNTTNKPSSNLQEVEKSDKNLKSIIRNIIGLNLDDLVRKKTNFSIFISDVLIFTAVGPALILIFSFFASWFLTGLLLNPLDKMAEIMKQVGKEGGTTQIHIRGSDEIENLSDEFNLMTNRLEEYHRSSLGHVLREYRTLKAALDFIPNPILLFNHKRELIYKNQSAEQTLNILKNNSLFNPFMSLDNQSQEKLNQIINTVITSKQPFIPMKSDDAITINVNNKKTFFFPLVYPVKKIMGNNDENVSGIFIFLEDLTNQRSSDLGITEVYETLLHEFQSPLTDVQMAIYTTVQELAGPLTPKQQEILYSARDKCEVLEKLCQDLLNFSRVNITTLENKHEEVDLVKLVSGLIPSLQLDNVEKGIFVEFQEPPYLKSIMGNRTQLEILFGNLMRNAFQYANPKTTVTINLQEKPNFIEFSINNKGTQIPPEHRKNVFKKYFKVPEQASERAGLGLYIAKQITDSLGGKIGFKTTQKRGTTFWVHLPFTDTKTERDITS